VSPTNDGGPAFPCSDLVTANGDVQPGCNGMTLRDWFAGQALAGLVTMPIPTPSAVDLAFYAADCMIVAREKGTK